jgi:ribulose-bisphosphate carboxylase large chain
MSEVVATYYVETEDLEKAAIAIAKEQSTGTWTEVGYETKEIQRRYGAKIKDIDKEGIIKIAFPVEDFSLQVGGIPNILSIVAGNLFGLKELKNCRLLDVEFPEEIVKFFKGPNYGIPGIRKILGTEKMKRPHVGTIVKPKIGLSPKAFAQVCYDAALGGLDLIKDDETLVDKSFALLEIGYLLSWRCSTGQKKRPVRIACMQ